MHAALTLQPIGYIRTSFASDGAPQKFHALHQPPEHDTSQRNILELLPDPRLQQALDDLEGFSRIWIIWWFHKTTTWKPKVLPPRGVSKRRGLFATRSPKRPNPLALTPVQLLGIEGRKLILGPFDAIDGTPVFDIKPYIPLIDSFPDARAGWTEENEAAQRLPPPYSVHYSALALVQAEWLAAEWQIDFTARIHELLGRDPSPHRTRRIKRVKDGESRIECGAWRVRFRIEDKSVHVIDLQPGYPESRLLQEGHDRIPDRAAQVAFLAKWPL
jgi:tRNA-Thr(GGU) m(6)t(6)A37 methyltransferase TsaA